MPKQRNWNIAPSNLMFLNYEKGEMFSHKSIKHKKTHMYDEIRNKNVNEEFAARTGVKMSTTRVAAGSWSAPKLSVSLSRFIASLVFFPLTYVS